METKRYMELVMITGNKFIFEEDELAPFSDQDELCNYSEKTFNLKCFELTDWKGKIVRLNPDHIVCWYDYNPYNPID